MGCTSSIQFGQPKRKSSKVTIDTLDSETGKSSAVKQRYGHPAYYKADGYEVGLRFKIKSNFQSFFVGTARTNGEKVTVKEHHLSAAVVEEDIYNEIKILSKLSHPNIPKLSEIFITNISIFMITDFIDGMRMRHHIDFKNKTTTLTVNDARSVIKAVLSATAYCHSNGIIIRNLTADNIVVKKGVDGNYETKIADFTLAVPDNSIKVLCDHALFEWESVPYLAPEALLGHPYTNKMDMWSIGVLLYLMVSAELPFDSTDDKELVEKIRYATFQYKSSHPVWSGPDGDKIKYLIGQLLVVTANDRPTCKEIQKNEWLVAG